eukprot:c5682_g1_i1.p1 GENE.c5682_g1_i1~~c5682_g1_i1.p1  ORF type:complete len:732 (+),score=197.58 c5682_g1_i1:52-2196(+)
MAALVRSRAVSFGSRRAFSRASALPQLAICLQSRHTVTPSLAWHPPRRFTSTNTSLQLKQLDSNTSLTTVEKELHFLKSNYASLSKKDVYDWHASALSFSLAPPVLNPILSNLAQLIRTDQAIKKLAVEDGLVQNKLQPILATATQADTTTISLSTIAVACDTVTALVSASHPSTGIELLGLTEENPLGLARDIADLAAKTSNPSVTAVALELLAVTSTMTVSSAEAVTGRLAYVLGFLTSDYLLGATSLPLVRAALGVLRQLSVYGRISKRLNENILNSAIQAIRANSSDWRVVNNALAFLANMRESVYKEKPIALGVVSEIDYLLTVIDSMQNHSSDPWLVSNGFRFLLAINPEDPVIGRVGAYHAGVIKSLLVAHVSVADVQVYGLLAVEVMARTHANVFNKKGMLEHCDKIHDVFYDNVYVRNCASFLSHTLRKTTRGEPHNYTSLPPDWDNTAGGPGTMIKLEGDGLTTYVGGFPESLDENDRRAFTIDALERGQNSADHLEQPFSDDEMEGIIDMEAGTTDDDVPDLQLMDPDPTGELLDMITREELESYMDMRSKNIDRTKALSFIAPMNFTMDDINADEWIAPALALREYAKDQHRVDWAVGHLKTLKKAAQASEKQGFDHPIKVKDSGDIELKVWRDDTVMGIIEDSMNRGNLVQDILVGLDKSLKVKEISETKGAEGEGESAVESNATATGEAEPQSDDTKPSQ